MTRILLNRVAIFIIAFAVYASAEAQTFQAGYGKYIRSDFKGAEASFKQALAKRMSAADQAKTYKFLGISQFMQKKTREAEQSLGQSLRLNPATNIASNEVLDPGVISFFNRIKGSRARTPVATAPARQTATPKRPRAATGDVKTTRMRIDSNVLGASVLVDGILAGNVGTSIEADPGNVVFEVNAPGYLSKKLRATIVAGRENVYRVNLDRPKPKVAPVRKMPVARAASAPKNNSLTPDSKAGKALFGEDDIGQDPSLAGRDLASEFAADGAAAAPAPQMAPQVQQQPTYPTYQQAPVQQPYLIQPQQPMYQPAPMYQQPYGMQAPYSYPQMPYGPVMQQPQYVQPGYAQPYPQPQAQPYVTQPGYNPYGPTTVTPPLPQSTYPESPAAATQPVMDSPQDIDALYGKTESKDEVLPLDPYKPRKQKSTAPPKVKSSPNKSRNYDRPARPSRGRTNAQKVQQKSPPSLFIAVLPFGAGQFQNESYLLGAAFLGGEVFALYWYYTNKQLGDQTVADNEAYQDDPNNTEAQKDDYQSQSETYVAARRQQQYIGLGGFVGLWALGATEAIWNMPTKKESNPKSKRRRLALQTNEDGELEVVGVGGEENGLEDTSLKTGDLVANQLPPAVLDVGIFPEETMQRPAVGLRLRLKF